MYSPTLYDASLLVIETALTNARSQKCKLEAEKCIFYMLTVPPDNKFTMTFRSET